MEDNEMNAIKPPFSRNETQAETVRFQSHRPRSSNNSSDNLAERESSSKQVIATCSSEEACRPDLEEAPVFYPTEEEFEDPIKFIASIRLQAERYGICRIAPPVSWKPPCLLKNQQVWESKKFRTRVQRIDELQNRNSVTKKSVTEHQATGDPSDEDETPGFEDGPDFTLHEFQAYDHDFKTHYFKNPKPSLEDIEGEYWRIVQKPTVEIEVLYGADLKTEEIKIGFSKNLDEVEFDCDDKYINSGWNLNNLPRLPGSLLSYEGSDISGVVVPWLYVGMCFSSFCWHVEDHHLYSVNYLHWGEPKVWYGVPSTKALKLEATMKKYLPHLFNERPDLLHRLVTQISPTILKKEDVPVYRCVQKAGEFIVTFPRAYHAGFNCGFNCAGAVNVAPIDWLPHGQNAVEVYRNEGRKSTISHDKLLLQASKSAVKAQWENRFLKTKTPDNLRWLDACGKEGILFLALKSRVEMEKNMRQTLRKSSKKLKMESSFDDKTERECCVCFYDLHLSAAGCHNCSPNIYACLKHAKKLCSCSFSTKFFIFRYEMDELNALVDALRGDWSAVNNWAIKEDLTLSIFKLIEKFKTTPEKLKLPFPWNLSSEVSSITIPNAFKMLVERNGVAWSGSGKRAPRVRKVIANISTIAWSYKGKSVPRMLKAIDNTVGNNHQKIIEQSRKLPTNTSSMTWVCKSKRSGT